MVSQHAFQALHMDILAIAFRGLDICTYVNLTFMSRQKLIIIECFAASSYTATAALLAIN